MMKKVKHKLVCLCMVIISVSNMSGSVFAQQCSVDTPPQTCTETSVILKDYLDSMYYILSQVKVNSFEDLEDYKTSDIITQSSQEAYYQGKKTFDLGKAVTLSSRTLSGRYGGDLLANTKILFNSKVAIRDRKLLGELDEDISAKLNIILQNNIYFRNISTKRVTALNSVISRLEFIEKIEVKETTSYGDLIMMLRGINSVYKNLYFEAINNSKNAQNARDGLVKLRNDLNSSINMEIDSNGFQGYKKLLERDYSCSTGSSDICPGSIAKFQKSLKHILSYASETGGSSMEKFQTNMVRLKQALQHITGQNTGEDFLERRDDLLYEYYGGDAQEILDCKDDANCMWGIGKSWNNLKKDVIQPSMGVMDKTKYEIQKLFEKDDANNPPNIPSNENVELKKRISKQTLDFRSVLRTISDNHNLKSSNITMEDPVSRTKFIPSLSTEVYKSISLIGSKQSKQGIVWNLGQACKNQCTNIPSVCRYE
ncbi:MAG: hypothetical protein V3575_06360 [Candidatus Absconditabacteria bacterium]